MAQYEQQATTVKQNIENSGLSSQTKQAILQKTGETGAVSIFVFDGTQAPAGTKIVEVPKNQALTQDPGGQIIILAPDAQQGANVVLQANQDRVVVASGKSDNISFQGNANVTVETGGGNDTITTGAGNDVVTVTGSGQSSVATGEGSDQVVVTGDSQVTVNTGTGNDVIVMQTDKGAVTVDAGAGFDKVQLNDSKANHSFSLQGGQLKMNSAPITIQGVEVIQFNNGITVVAENHAKAVVAKLYEIAFDREADLGGLEYWMGRVDAGDSLEHIVYSFLNSPEFNSTLGAKSNEDFLKALYKNMAGRDPDAGGFQFWMGKLAEGMDRAKVVWAFAESLESVQVLGIDGSKYVIELG